MCYSTSFGNLQDVSDTTHQSSNSLFSPKSSAQLNEWHHYHSVSQGRNLDVIFIAFSRPLTSKLACPVDSAFKFLHLCISTATILFQSDRYSIVPSKKSSWTQWIPWFLGLSPISLPLTMRLCQVWVLPIILFPSMTTAHWPSLKSASINPLFFHRISVHTASLSAISLDPCQELAFTHVHTPINTHACMCTHSLN